MRIAKLDLLAYGPFRGLELDLSAPGIHVVFGRNEAGKSTTLRAIKGLLYGIDARTRDAHVHKPQELRIAGTLVAKDGERLRVVRRKGNSNTLLDDRGQAIDDALLLRLVRGVSEETFEHAFGLDHETLRRGAQALLEGKGDLGESLFDAGVGGGGEVQRLLAELTEEADRIYRPRASSLPLNEALKAFGEAQKAVRDTQTLPEAHVAQEHALDEARAARTEKVRHKGDLVALRARIERACKRLPRERRRAALVAEKEALGSFAREASRIAALVVRMTDHERALEARRKLEAELARAETRAEEAARRAGAPATGTRLDGPKEARLQRFVSDRLGLEKNVAHARAEIDRAERALDKIRRDAPKPPADEADASALARAHGRARELGDAEARLASETTRVLRKRKELEGKASALGGHAHALDALVALDLPPPAALDALAKRADAIERAIARVEQRIASNDVETAAAERQIAEHAGAFAPPSAADLAAKRAHRDEAWLALRAETDAKKRAPLEAAVERAMRDADAMADRMLAEADRVTALARLESARAALVAQRQKVDAELDEHRDALEKLDAELAALFAPARVEPTTPAAMRTWLDRHADLAEAHASLVAAEEDVAGARRAIEDAKRDLAAALGVDAGASARLADLVADAQGRLTAIEDARRAAAEASRASAKLEEDLETRRASLARDEAALAETKAKLAELLRPLGLDDDASADEVARALEAGRELSSAIDAREKTEAALRAVGDEIRAFAEDVAAAARAVAPDLADAPPIEAARAFAQRIARLEAIDREIASIDEALAELGDEPIGEDVAAIAADPDAARRRTDELDTEIEEAERDLLKVSQQVWSLEEGLRRMRGDSNAAEAAAQAQQALARVRTQVERWCRAKLASVILSREIDRYRDENQGPLLGRASALFARLTLGAFTGMKTGFDDRDRPALRFVRAGGAGDVDVTALSEGTRDQLYLALRLASLLRFAEIAEPMPLVLDDVLVHFDDERSAAALAVLAEVSRTMQVLFFTHHARLVELARGNVPGDALVVHELPVRTPAVEKDAAIST